MIRHAFWRGAGILAAFSILVGAVHAGEIAVDKVPKPVLDKVKARFADATVTGAAKEKTEEGNEIYEISLEDESLNTIDLTLTPEGALLLIEQQIERKDLPEVVTKTLEEKYPKSRYRLVEQLFEVEDDKETLTSYEVLLVTPKKQMWSVQLDLEGAIMNVEEKFEDEDD